MSLELLLSMAGFALFTSITPGPVNILALSSGARHGPLASQPYVLGSTLGFTALLLLLGAGMQQVLLHWPWLLKGLQGFGIAFLLYMAWKLVLDSGALHIGEAGRPGFFTGAALQWLNPKAWLACVAGLGNYVAAGDSGRLLVFALIYAGVCHLSVACWSVLGGRLQAYLGQPSRLRGFNRGMALLLLLCVAYLLLGET